MRAAARSAAARPEAQTGRPVPQAIGENRGIAQPLSHWPLVIAVDSQTLALPGDRAAPEHGSD